MLATNQRRRDVQTRTDDARARRNALSKEVGGLMKAGKAAEAEAIKDEVRGLGAALDSLEDERKALEAEEDDLLLRLPNRLNARVTTGASEADNRVVHT
ncbi:MAG: serine--tRNA ligase, partial [bacterium]